MILKQVSTQLVGKHRQYFVLPILSTFAMQNWFPWNCIIAQVMFPPTCQMMSQQSAFLGPFPDIAPDSWTVHVFLKLTRELMIPTVCSQWFGLSSPKIEFPPVIIFISMITIIDSCCPAKRRPLCKLRMLCILCILCELCNSYLEPLRNTERWPLSSGYVSSCSFALQGLDLFLFYLHEQVKGLPALPLTFVM